MREEKLEQQLRKIVTKAGLHPGWKKYFVSWMKEDEIKEKQKIKMKLKILKKEIEEIDQKLNRLLDAYLDQVIGSKAYKEKENELFEQKLKLEEKILKIQKDGSSWLKPMRKFINCALQTKKSRVQKRVAMILRSWR